jgi:hypothetical protein
MVQELFYFKTLLILSKALPGLQYRLPQDENSASLLITDNLGRTVKTFQLTASGVLNFDTSSLSSGIYNFSLILDNKTIETKKMTVVK